MNRALRARLWLATATAGAVVFVVSIAGMLRSCHAPTSAACVTTARVDPQVAHFRDDLLCYYNRSRAR